MVDNQSVRCNYFLIARIYTEPEKKKVHLGRQVADGKNHNNHVDHSQEIIFDANHRCWGSCAIFVLKNGVLLLCLLVLLLLFLLSVVGFCRFSVGGLSHDGHPYSGFPLAASDVSLQLVGHGPVAQDHDQVGQCVIQDKPDHLVFPAVSGSRAPWSCIEVHDFMVNKQREDDCKRVQPHQWKPQNDFTVADDDAVL